MPPEGLIPDDGTLANAIASAMGGKVGTPAPAPPPPPPSKRLIGNWGIHILFQVGLEKMMTFHNASKKVASRFAEHAIVGNVPRLEWLGPEITEITMDVYMSVELGVHVGNMLNTIEQAVRQGIANDLWIAGKRVGTNKFIIESIDEDWIRTYQNGELTHAKASLTFREYYEGEK